MRKQIIGETAALTDAEASPQWLDLQAIASGQLTSEDPAFPFEAALEAGGRGWRAAAPGPQTIQLRFDQPQRIRRVRLRFSDRDHERQQEFVLRYTGENAVKPKEIVRQQWTFSPGGSNEEVEDYTVDLAGVTSIELEIDPDRGRGTLPATLAELMMA